MDEPQKLGVQEDIEAPAEVPQKWGHREDNRGSAEVEMSLDQEIHWILWRKIEVIHSITWTQLHLLTWWDHKRHRMGHERCRTCHAPHLGNYSIENIIIAKN